MHLTSPHNVLTAYSKGSINAGQAQSMLGRESYRELVLAMADAGHPLPRPSDAEVAAQVDAAYGLLRSVLISEWPNA